jgi:hypothetical protein
MRQSNGPSHNLEDIQLQSRVQEALTQMMLGFTTAYKSFNEKEFKVANVKEPGNGYLASAITVALREALPDHEVCLAMLVVSRNKIPNRKIQKALRGKFPNGIPGLESPQFAFQAVIDEKLVVDVSCDGVELYPIEETSDHFPNTVLRFMGDDEDHASLQGLLGQDHGTFDRLTIDALGPESPAFVFKEGESDDPHVDRCAQLLPRFEGMTQTILDHMREALSAPRVKSVDDFEDSFRLSTLPSALPPGDQTGNNAAAFDAFIPTPSSKDIEQEQRKWKDSIRLKRTTVSLPETEDYAIHGLNKPTTVHRALEYFIGALRPLPHTDRRTEFRDFAKNVMGRIMDEVPRTHGKLMPQTTKWLMQEVFYMILVPQGDSYTINETRLNEVVAILTEITKDWPLVVELTDSEPMTMLGNGDPANVPTQPVGQNRSQVATESSYG